MTRILVVDDSEVDRRLIGGLLEADGDYEVDFATDGATALESIERDLPDVIVTDLVMPGKDGLARAQILCHADDFVALVTKGHHRVAALSALGHANAPFWPLPEMVRREEATDWPGVRSGIFTLEQALAVFDRMFAGKQVLELATAYLPAVLAQYGECPLQARNRQPHDASAPQSLNDPAPQE